MAAVSIVIPAFNEAGAVAQTIQKVQQAFEGSEHSCEVIVVDDGSKDETAVEAEKAGATLVRHPYNIGYGNALLTGICHAQHPIVGITDADGTYPVHELPKMVTELEERKLDMLVGARTGKQYYGSFMKRIARFWFKVLAEYTCGRTIPDINSGLRVMRRDMVMRYAPVLCGGFSFTTTITIIAILTNHFVAYRKIEYARRVGKSHVRYFRDTLRSAQILIMTIVLFNPIKLYLLYAMFVLGVGVAAILVCAFFPELSNFVLIASLYFLAASLLIGSSFLSEQRRVGGLNVVDDVNRRLREQRRDD